MRKEPHIPLSFIRGYLLFFQKVTWIRFKKVASKRVERKLVSPKYIEVIKRGEKPIEYAHRFRDITKDLLDYLEEDQLDEWIKKERVEFLEKFDVSVVEDIKKEGVSSIKKEIKRFKRIIKKIKKPLLKRRDLTPLNYYLVDLLDLMPTLLDVDFRMFKELEADEYYSLVRMSFEEFPEKILLFMTPFLSFHLLLESLSLIEKTHLSRALRKLEFKIFMRKPQLLKKRLPKFSEKKFLNTELAVR